MTNFGLLFPGRILATGNGMTLPCMTDYEAPYGVASASSEVIPGNEAWKAFSEDMSDYWITDTFANPDIPYDSNLNVYGHYIEYRYKDEDLAQYGLFQIQRIEFTPPQNQDASWYQNNNPRKISVVAEDENGDLIKLYTNVFDDWKDSSKRVFVLYSEVEVRSVRIYVEETHQSASGGDYATGSTCILTTIKKSQYQHPYGVVHYTIPVYHDLEEVIHT